MVLDLSVLVLKTRERSLIEKVDLRPTDAVGHRLKVW